MNEIIISDKKYNIPDEVVNLLNNTSKERDMFKDENKKLRKQSIDTYTPEDILDNYVEDKYNILKLMIGNKETSLTLLNELFKIKATAESDIEIFKNEYSFEEMQHFKILLKAI
jgi:hypothetical protein